MLAANPNPQETLLFADLAEAAATAHGLDSLAAQALPVVARMQGVSSSALFIAGAHPIGASFHQYGFDLAIAANLERHCAEKCAGDPGQFQNQPQGLLAEKASLFPLVDGKKCLGLLAIGQVEEKTEAGQAVLSRATLPTAKSPRQATLEFSPNLWRRSLDLLAGKVSSLVDQRKSAQQLSHLNTYLTVSSTLAQLMGLHDVLEIALYSCMEAASAETASVLLLDDEGKYFNFYHVEGPTKPILMTETFPADKGLAGSVLQSQQGEIINRVQEDSRFYQQVDSKSGFQTRNMIAVPLTAGQEQVGVLEVLNKIDGDFLDEEMMLLVLIAEEIAYAIRNARVFELVVKSYCKQLQGLTSCAGCERPLRTWTPCVKYEEIEGVRF